MSFPLKLVNGRMQDNKSITFDILLTDYFSASSFPFTCPLSPAATEETTSDTVEANPLTHLFIHANRLNDLITLYRLNVLQKLVPHLRKEGYTELAATATTSASTNGASGSGSRTAETEGNLGRTGGPYYPDRGGPLGMMPVPDRPAYFSPPTGDGSVPSPNAAMNPFNIGRSDLDPLGGMNGNFPGFPGTQGPAFGSGGTMGQGQGGMFMGPDHPMFQDRFRNGGDPLRSEYDMRAGIGGLGEGMRGGQGMGGMGGFGGGMVPPGARYDPMGPGVRSSILRFPILSCAAVMYDATDARAW